MFFDHQILKLITRKMYFFPIAKLSTRDNTYIEFWIHRILNFSPKPQFIYQFFSSLSDQIFQLPIRDNFGNSSAHIKNAGAPPADDFRLSLKKLFTYSE